MNKKQTTPSLNKTISNDIVIAPVLVFICWYLFGYLWLYPQVSKTQTGDSFLIVIIIAMASRIATGIWSVVLTNKFGLKQNPWILLALFIGPTQLIFINFSIWYKQSEIEKK